MVGINETIDKKRIIGANIHTDLYIWIDAANAVHSNMRSHNGGVISMRHGVSHKKAFVKRLNKKSSTEAELICVSEYLLYNLWLMIFLKGQGYGIMKNIVYQDKQSTIRMEKNGRNSCTGNSRHINIIIFSMTEYIKRDWKSSIAQNKWSWQNIYRPNQGKCVKNIQWRNNGLQTHILIWINHSFNLGAYWK